MEPPTKDQGRIYLLRTEYNQYCSFSQERERHAQQDSFSSLDLRDFMSIAMCTLFIVEVLTAPRLPKKLRRKLKENGMI